MLDKAEAERLNRIEALEYAARHRLHEESPDEVVLAAQKYFTFLQGNLPEKLCSCQAQKYFTFLQGNLSQRLCSCQVE
jgi:hypothetical protein